MALSIPPANPTKPSAAQADHAGGDPLESHISQLWQRSSPDPTPPSPDQPLSADDLPGASQLLPRLLRLLAEHPNRPTASFRPVVRRMILDTSFCCDAGDPVGLRQSEAHADQLTDRIIQLLDQTRQPHDHDARPELRLG
ncbi:MAG: hypothetical protein AAF750_17540 [Planctomycetota bacterium]